MKKTALIMFLLIGNIVNASQELSLIPKQVNEQTIVLPSDGVQTAQMRKAVLDREISIAQSAYPELFESVNIERLSLATSLMSRLNIIIENILVEHILCLVESDILFERFKSFAPPLITFAIKIESYIFLYLFLSNHKPENTLGQLDIIHNLAIPELSLSHVDILVRYPNVLSKLSGFDLATINGSKHLILILWNLYPDIEQTTIRELFQIKTITQFTVGQIRGILQKIIGKIARDNECYLDFSLDLLELEIQLRRLKIRVLAKEKRVLYMIIRYLKAHTSKVDYWHYRQSDTPVILHLEESFKPTLEPSRLIEFTHKYRLNPSAIALSQGIKIEMLPDGVRQGARAATGYSIDALVAMYRDMILSYADTEVGTQTQEHRDKYKLCMDAFRITQTLLLSLPSYLPTIMTHAVMRQRFIITDPTKIPLLTAQLQCIANYFNDISTGALVLDEVVTQTDPTETIASITGKIDPLDPRVMNFIITTTDGEQEEFNIKTIHMAILRFASIVTNCIQGQVGGMKRFYALLPDVYKIKIGDQGIAHASPAVRLMDYPHMFAFIKAFIAQLRTAIEGSIFIRERLIDAHDTQLLKNTIGKSLGLIMGYERDLYPEFLAEPLIRDIRSGKKLRQYQKITSRVIGQILRTMAREYNRDGKYLLLLEARRLAIARQLPVASYFDYLHCTKARSTQQQTIGNALDDEWKLCQESETTPSFLLDILGQFNVVEPISMVKSARWVVTRHVRNAMRYTLHYTRGVGAHVNQGMLLLSFFLALIYVRVVLFLNLELINP